MQYSILISGEAAARAGLAFQAGQCYRSIMEHGRRLAQLETVAADLVEVAYIKPGDVDKVLRQLSRIGFSGLLCIVAEEKTSGCYAYQRTVCATVI